MRTKLLTSFIVVTGFWWAVSFILWSSGPYSSNLGAMKDIAALLDGWVSLKAPVDVANTSLLDSWAVQWFVLMYWTGPVLLLTALSTGVGSIRVWKHAAEFKKERDIREAAETIAFRGVGCTKGKLPRIGAPVQEIHMVELEGFSPEINQLISEILSTIHEGYSNGTLFKGDEVDGDWMEYIEEKCQYVLEVSKEKELALVAALGVEIGKISAYTSKKGAPGKPLKFSRGGQHKTFALEGAKQIAKLEAWWKLSPELRVATVSVLRYLEQPQFMPDGLFKDGAIKERVLTAIEDVYDIKPVEDGAEPSEAESRAGASKQKDEAVANSNKPTVSSTKKQTPQSKESSISQETSGQVKAAQQEGVVSNPGDFEKGYTAEQEAKIRESLAERFKTLQEQDGVKSNETADAVGFDNMFGDSDFPFPKEAIKVDGPSEQEDNLPPWESPAKATEQEFSQKPLSGHLDGKKETQHSADDSTQEVVSQAPVNSVKSEAVHVKPTEGQNQKPAQETPAKKKKVVVDNTPAAGGFLMTPGAESMLEPSPLDRHLDKAMLDLWPIMSFHSPNQPKGAQAFGWKQGKRIYLIEIKFREAVAKRIPAEVLENLAPTSYNEKLNALSRELIAYFIRKGLIVNKIENVVLSAREPLWKIRAGLYEFNGVFALDVTPEILEMLPTYNSKFQLSVSGCLWSHTIISGRFPKRDAEGNIVVEAPETRPEKRQKEHRQGQNPAKQAPKDPSIMSGLPADLLAPNSGKFKKEAAVQTSEDGPSEADGATVEVNPIQVGAANKLESAKAKDRQTNVNPKADLSSKEPLRETLQGTPASSSGAVQTKPTGLDLLSLVTSGLKPNKKPLPTSQGHGGQQSQKQVKPNRDGKESKPGEARRADKEINPKQADGTHELSQVTSVAQTVESEKSADETAELAQQNATSKLIEDSSPDVKKGESSAESFSTGASEPEKIEEAESFSFSLTDIAAKSGSLEAHIPDAESVEYQESTTESESVEETKPDELDVDSLIDDFAMDLEKSRLKSEGDDKP